MTEFGVNLASEVHGPNELIEYARGAENAGFDFAVVSDHFHPWISDRGHGESPFVWSTLGGLAREIDELELGTAVTCPTIRIHPANVAQAAATAAVMADGRFFLGVGAGENLNEHVTGEHWPEHEVRIEMLEEALEVIRALWTGKHVSHHGEHYTVENARLFTLPDEPPPIHVSGLGPKAATAAGRIGDGFICTSPDQTLVEQYEAGGGDGPRIAGTKVCWAESDDEARQTVHEWWPQAGLPSGATELPTPAHFDEAVADLSEDDVAEAFVTGPNPDPYVDHVEEFLDAGFDRIYIHQIGPDQAGFFEFWKEELRPRLAY